MNNHQSKLSTQAPNSKRFIACPLCESRVLLMTLNDHLDICPSNKHKTQQKQHIPRQGNTLKSYLSGNNRLPSTANESSPSSDKTSSSKRNHEVINLDNEPATPAAKKTSTSTTGVNATQSSIESKLKEEIAVLKKSAHLPLSERLRPQTLREYVGQQHILSQEKGPLFQYIRQGIIPSMILWGPPGVGKTSLARLFTKEASAVSSSGSKDERPVHYWMIETSATKANTQELRGIFEKAKKEFQLTRRRTVLFIDEIHRFNKVQQDLLLPHVENGDIILIGATTENPSFQLNNALISRCQVFVLEKLSTNEMCIVLYRAIALLNRSRKLLWGDIKALQLSRDIMEYIVDVSVGDARRALNILEKVEISTRQDDKTNGKGNSAETAESEEKKVITLNDVRDIIKNNSDSILNTYYDVKGDFHYDAISAFHKAVRGSDENASLYYLARMLQGGEDPLYVARRMIRIASEDIGIRDNSLLSLAIAAHDTVMKLGLPEADMALVHCCVALARAPKSVEIYRAWNNIKSMLNENKYSLASSEIPMHIRNAPTSLMKDLGYSKGYKYNPDYVDGKVKQEYFPEEVLHKCPNKKELQFLTGKHLGTRVDPDLLKDKK
ncbi:ssDNA-dependent ATPase MGS1 NDAI_0F03710 [Naumovozyma dairenensis CBS 421]|uniref:AAA+ ATPase domain-containing protein n=1 Tax=Naumovozyma dairenensis (strain ATCC 10597 / BCRC 20456 / CBS 421 / NBRC 0211 / NRRL Y-12639) TaxID=1071378 RepID=G0WD28_NAUDC|nr:hypothetical protein NDAI_0F03710 [Naumovozyma dairenensis CBS 421]CCD25689.1 hypothetical protein NDAI_0F03710 [Naumovozyma dairenensis CBS 421]